MAIWDDAWGAVKSVGKSIGGYITGKEDAQTVQAPEIDRTQFQQGGPGGLHSADMRASAYYHQADRFGSRSQDAQNRAAAPQVAQAGALADQSMGQWQDSRGRILSEAYQRGPSQAEAQLRAGQDAAMRQQLALARSGRGLGGEATAMRNAAFNVGDISAQTNQQAAQLRAQEEQAQLARQMQALQYVGGTDAAMGQFGLQQGLQGEMAQRGLNDARSATLLQAQLGSQQMMDQQLAGQRAANMQYELARTGNLLNADAQSAQLVSGRGNALIGGISTMAGAAMGLGTSDERSKTEKRELRAENEDLRRMLAALDGIGQEQVSAIRGAGTQREPTMADLDAIGRDAVQTIREAPGHTYRYRDPNQPGAAPGLQAGPMAQDLEQTPLGRSMVREGPDGTKMVDLGRAGLTALAAASAQQRELDQVRAEQEELQRQLRALGTGGRR